MLTVFVLDVNGATITDDAKTAETKIYIPISGCSKAELDKTTTIRDDSTYLGGINYEMGTEIDHKLDVYPKLENIGKYSNNCLVRPRIKAYTGDDVATKLLHTHLEITDKMFEEEKFKIYIADATDAKYNALNGHHEVEIEYVV